MGYSPFAHIGFGIQLSKDMYEKVVDENTGDCVIDGLEIGFIGDSRAGFCDYVLVLSETLVETDYGPIPILNESLHQDPETLKETFLSLLNPHATVIGDETPQWLIWAATI